MKVILLEDVKKQGKKGDIVEVSDGYARNYLLARKLGVEATNQHLNDLKLKKQNEDRRKKELLEEAKSLKNSIQDKEVVVGVKSGEGGKIFGSVSTKEIAKATQDQLAIEVDKKKMQLKEPIKSLGSYKVPIKLHPKVIAEINVKVIAE